MITRIADHAATAVATLLAVIRAKAINIPKLVTAIADEIQVAEDEAYSLIADRQLDTAEGASLDQCGAIVGETRNGFSDEWYRRFTKVKILANRSCGQPINLAKVLVGIMAPFAENPRYFLLSPAAFGFSYTRTAEAGYSSDAVRARLVQILDLVQPAGVLLAEVRESVPGSWGFEGDDQAEALGTGEFTTELVKNGD